jgi:CMP/dCMP kinase
MRKLIVAIDGPAGSGKSTAARRVAELLGYAVLDTGAMYRAVALKAMESGTPLDAAARVIRLAREAQIELRGKGREVELWLDGADVTARIRRAEMAEAASKVAQIPEVRELLVAAQRWMGSRGGMVVEGRDIATVVFPNAGLKIYLTASVEVRARRRLGDLVARGQPAGLEEVIREVRERDRRDREREASPLALAPDAVLVDTTAMEPEEVARLIVLLAREAAEPGSGS